MTREEYLNSVYNVIYLAGCAVNDTIPDKEKIAKMNLEYLYQAAQKHMLTAVVDYALKSAGIINEKFHQVWAKSVRKVAAMEIDKELLFREMEKEKIWYLPLKGIIIKDFYPAVGLRQMSDFDILFDKNYAEKVRDILTKLGFTCKLFGKEEHDIYIKQPVSHFQMHTALFIENNDNGIYEYYRNVKMRLIKDENKQYGYHFSNQDLYIYLTAHEYKHYSTNGTGLRSILDTYVFWQKLGDQLDTDYITAETKKMGIHDFEQQNRSLAMHLFGNGELNKADLEMLEYIIFSGTYGTLCHRIENTVKKSDDIRKDKRDFIIRKIFIPIEQVKVHYPFYYRHKILLPVLFFYRIGRALTVSRKKTKATLKILKKLK